MLNFAPWYYKNLLGTNSLIESPDFYQVSLLSTVNIFESNVKLKDKWRPSWLSKSSIYKDCDGSGTDKFKNVAVYKAISEALERLAFYELIDTHEIEYAFDKNPTTTGMAAYPHPTYTPARANSKLEAVERWAIHQFNNKKLPIKLHPSTIENLRHFEILTPFHDVKVSLLVFENKGHYYYGFAGGKNIGHSFEKSLVELDRNFRVLNRIKVERKYTNYESAVDRTLFFYSTKGGYEKFSNLVNSAPKSIICQMPKIICDKPLKGHWSKYTKVWRFLLEDSYYPCHEDHTFFMF